MARIKQLSKRGFTLVELMIVVVIIGILAALAIYGVQKYVTNSKSAEARMSVGRMTKDAAGHWEGEQMAGALIPLGSSVGTSHTLCTDAVMVPSSLVAEGEKYQPENTPTTDFGTGSDTGGWKCLGFGIDQAIYFSYGYTAAGTAFTSSAQAKLGGKVKQIFQTGAVTGTQLVVSPSLCDVEVEVANAATDPGIKDMNGDCIAD